MTANPIATDIRALFGERAATSVGTTSSTGEPYPLFDAESRAVEKAVPKRRAEFARGRHVARAALAALGAQPAPIPVGPNREPIWPPGFVGSITHTDGLIAAAVARITDLTAIGIDAEPATALPDETRSLILLPNEHSSDEIEEKLIFSAKESIYKAVFPKAGVWIDFLEVEVSLDADSGTFSAAYLGTHEHVRSLVGSLHGRCLRRDDFVVTGCYIRPPDE